MALISVGALPILVMDKYSAIAVLWAWWSFHTLGVSNEAQNVGPCRTSTFKNGFLFRALKIPLTQPKDKVAKNKIKAKNPELVFVQLIITSIASITCEP